MTGPRMQPNRPRTPSSPVAPEIYEDMPPEMFGIQPVTVIPPDQQAALYRSEVTRVYGPTRTNVHLLLLGPPGASVSRADMPIHQVHLGTNIPDGPCHLADASPP